jgi:hypothetical protein
MVALNIIEIKKLMGSLLKGTVFDDFEVRNVEVQTFTKFRIDGILNKSFFSTDEQELYERNYVTWKEVKPFVLQIIKGNRTPTLLKIVFSLSHQETIKFSKDLSALFINLTFENNKMLCTTGSASKIFSLDKSIDYEWDRFVEQFFKQNGVFVEKQI